MESDDFEVGAFHLPDKLKKKGSGNFSAMQLRLELGGCVRGIRPFTHQGESLAALRPAQRVEFSSGRDLASRGGAGSAG